MRTTYRYLAYAIDGLIMVQAAAMAWAIFGFSKYIDDGNTFSKSQMEANDFAFTLPARMPAGVVTFRLINHGRESHHAQVVRLEGEQRVEQGPRPVGRVAMCRQDIPGAAGGKRTVTGARGGSRRTAVRGRAVRGVSSLSQDRRRGVRGGGADRA